MGFKEKKDIFKTLDIGINGDFRIYEYGCSTFKKATMFKKTYPTDYLAKQTILEYKKNKKNKAENTQFIIIHYSGSYQSKIIEVI